METKIIVDWVISFSNGAKEEYHSKELTLEEVKKLLKRAGKTWELLAEPVNIIALQDTKKEGESK